METASIGRNDKQKVLFIGLALFVLLALIAALYGFKNSQDISSRAGTGNGSPAGKHYTLNLIGVPEDKTADMAAGNRIFVPLSDDSEIRLSAGTALKVVDGNATDGTAEFQLPNPDPTFSGKTVYSVFARSIGTRVNDSKTSSCVTDKSTTETYCSVNAMVMVRKNGQTPFINVSQQLLTASIDKDNDGVLERYPLFSPAMKGYLWDYDSKGMKVVQLRFYEVQTTLPDIQAP